MQVKRNVLNINYHVAEYKQIVTALRQQVASLKQKVQQMEKEKQELLGRFGYTVSCIVVCCVCDLHSVVVVCVWYCM